jgi:hypothetical protein
MEATAPASPSAGCRRSCSRDAAPALWWLAVNPPAWALAWVVTTFVITRNVKEHFAVFGASGALVFALLTWIVLTFVFRPNEREAKAA